MSSVAAFTAKNTPHPEVAKNLPKYYFYAPALLNMHHAGQGAIRAYLCESVAMVSSLEFVVPSRLYGFAVGFVSFFKLRAKG